MAIGVKEAVQHAFQHAKQLYADTTIKNLLLEEVEFWEEDNEWHVTLGFDAGRRTEKVTGTALLPDRTYEMVREYKIFYIDGEDGHFKKMQIRQV